MDVKLTHIGGPTVLIEFAGWRLLTDPTFDPAGGKYRFGWGTGSTKLTEPSLSPRSWARSTRSCSATTTTTTTSTPPAGRCCRQVGTVITTEAGARRLGGNARGLAPWATTELSAEGKPRIEVTATPCRHGPPLSRPLVGDVVGFALRWEGQEHGALWISGDTVLYDGVREVADRVDVGTALVHLGGVRFPVTGPLRYTMTAGEAVELLESAAARRPRSRSTTRAGATSARAASRSRPSSPRRRRRCATGSTGCRSAAAPRSASSRVTRSAKRRLPPGMLGRQIRFLSQMRGDGRWTM